MSSSAHHHQIPTAFPLPDSPSFLIALYTRGLVLFSLFLGLGTGVVSAAPKLEIEQPEETKSSALAWGYNSYGQTVIPSGLANVTAVAAGSYHTIALKSDGTVVAWGYNSQGQTIVPVGLTAVTAIADGDYHSVALKSDGTVVAWGANGAGQSTIPTGLSGVIAIAAGYEHTVALKTDGTVVAWGGNTYGQRTVPTGLASVTAIAAGDGHTVALKSDGTVVVWGDNSYGQRTVPTGLASVAAISGGAEHTVALKSDGTVVAWGRNTYGQTTIPVGLSHVSTVAAGGSHTVVITSEKSFQFNPVKNGLMGSTHTVTLKNTGDETLILDTFTKAGPHNDDFTVSAPVATTIPAGAATTFTLSFNPIAVGPRSTLLRISSNAVGSTTDIRLSGLALPSSNANLSSLIPSESNLSPAFDPLVSVYSITVTAETNTILFTAIKAQAESSIYFQGNFLTSGVASTPQPLLGGDNILKISVTAQDGVTKQTYTVTVTRLGPHLEVQQPVPASPIRSEVVAWGSNNDKQTTIPTGLENVTAISSGSLHSIALRENGYVVGWGSNDWGQTSIPTGLNNITAISAGSAHNLALKSDGTVVAWGANYYEQTTIPIGLTNVTAIAAGGNDSIAVKGDGTVVAWGYNGQITVPSGLTGVSAVAVGWFHAVALKRDGTVVAWGANYYGQASVPVGLANVIAIAAGSDHTVALKNDGTVVAWGDNRYGQTTIPFGLANVVGIASGDDHIVALKNDGTIVVWGGIGNPAKVAVPVKLSGVTAISAGSYHTVVLKNKIGSFAPQLYGTTSQPITLTIRNTGFSDLTIGAITKSGSHIADFAVSLPASTTIVPGGSTTFTVTFTPGGLGSRTAVLNISNNETGNFTVPLTGQGLPYANADLEALLTDAGSLTPSFDSATFDYTVTVPAETTSITFTPTVSQANATVKVRETSVNSGSISTAFPLLGEDNVFTIAVTAQDGVTKKNYTVTVTRLGPHLVVEQPVGNSRNSGYEIVFPNQLFGSTSTPLTITLRNTGFTDLILGSVLIGGVNASDFSVSSPEPTIPPGGSTTFTALFTPSGAGKRVAVLQIPTNETSDFNLLLRGWGTLHTNANLAGLTLDKGTLAPTFDSATTSYSASVSQDTTRVTLSPVLDQENATYVISSDRVGIISTGTPIPIYGGTNVIIVAVTAQNGVTRKSYTLSITRNGPLMVVEQPAGAPLSRNSLVGWGSNSSGERTIPTGLPFITSVAAGYGHTLALKGDGSVTAWGRNDYAQSRVPLGLSEVVAVSAGYDHSLALKRDGTVLAWGSNSYAQTTPPVGLTGVNSISAGYYHNLALKSDGTVVAWGRNAFGESTIPVGLAGVVAVSAGISHSVALKSDGSVVAWGYNGYKQSTVPAGLNEVIAIDAGSSHVVALKNNGTVVTWGLNDYGQTTVPVGLSNVTTISANGSYSLALKSDGTVVGWGRNTDGQRNIPAGLNGVTSIIAGRTHAFALKETALVDFGSRSTYSTSLKTFTVKNTGITDLNLGDFIKTGNHTGDFSVNSPTSSTIIPGGSTTFSVTFTPTELGPRSALLRIPNNEMGYFEVELTGSGTVSSDATLSGLSVSLGTLSPTFSSTVTSYSVVVPAETTSLTIKPTTTHPLATLKVNSLTTPSGTDSKPLILPSILRTVSVSVSVTAPNGTAKTYSISVRKELPYFLLSGTTATVSTNIIDTKRQVIQTTGISHVVTIWNYGYADLVISDFIKTGLNASEFTVSSPASSIPPSGSTTFTVTFSPTETGVRTANLALTTNDPDRLAQNITLKGTGALELVEQWKVAQFASNAAASVTDDMADPDGDGLSNLMEFGLGLSPTTRTLSPVAVSQTADHLVLTYPRSLAAQTAGIKFEVQSTDNLTTGIWSPANVSTETILSDDGTSQSVQVSVSNTVTARFLRLVVGTTP